MQWKVVEKMPFIALRNIPSETFVLTRDVTLSYATGLVAGRKYSKTGIHKIYGRKKVRTFLNAHNKFMPSTSGYFFPATSAVHHYL